MSVIAPGVTHKRRRRPARKHKHKSLKQHGRAFMAGQMTLAIPHIAAVVLACIAGAAQLLNQTTFALPSRWHAYIGLGLAVAAYLGIKPLVGDQFRQALPVPSWVSQAITTLLGVAAIVLGQLPADSPIQPELAAVVTMLLGLGFAGPPGQLAAQAAARRSAKRVSTAARRPRAAKS
jgi:hypothetical protein